MSPTNAETYQRVIEAFNKGGMDPVMAYFDEEIEVHDPDLLGGRPLRGHKELRQALEPMLGSWEALSVKDYDLIAAPDGERVVALIHLSATGKGTQGDMEVEMRDAHTMTFRDGKVVHWRLWLDQRAALEDAGLDPDLARDVS